MKLSVFGKYIEAIKKNGQWTVFYLGNEGKKRLANDIAIPASIPEDELIKYLADLLHESATDKHPAVIKL